jgi:hypothetical protein
VKLLFIPKTIQQMEETGRNRPKSCRLLWLLALLAAGGGTAVLLHLVSHPSLLDKATKTAFVLSPEYGGSSPYQWLSTHEVLVFDTLTSGTNQIEMALYRVDVVTGIKTRLIELERNLTPDSSLPYYAHVSPDGRRLLIFKGSAYQVVDLDGSGSHKWQDKKGAEVEDSYSRIHTFWRDDSRHAVQFLSSDVGRTHSLLIRDVDAPTVAQRTPLPDTPEWEAQNYFSLPSMTPGGVIFAYAPAFEENDTRTLLLIRTSSHPVKTRTTLHAPSGTTFVVAPERRGAVLTVSQDGTRMAWLCKAAPYTPPLRAWLHRFLPRVNDDPVYPMRLYVSSVDGSKAREIGSVEVGMTAEGWRASGSNPIIQAVWNSDPVQEISDLRWLPGGKRLSFVLQNTLYTVSAED